MIIEIHDREFAESEALETALVRTLWHQNVRKVDIFVSPRVPEDAPEWKHPGRLEYGLVFEYSTGGKMHIGMLQRTPDQPFEFHS